MICPSCGARNSADAGWCTQCYALLAPDAEPAAVPASAPRSAGADRDIRERDGEVEWRCSSCAGWSHLQLAACGTCGAPRRGFGEVAATSPSPDDGATLLGASLLLPGLGHLMAGRIGTGIARAVLAVLWLGGGLLLVVDGATAPGWTLLVGAGVLWTLTAVDVRRLADGTGTELLGTRGFGLLVAVVTGTLLLSTVVATAVVR